jgi:uncharacterized low-complexity protein
MNDERAREPTKKQNFSTAASLTLLLLLLATSAARAAARASERGGKTLAPAQRSFCAGGRSAAHCAPAPPRSPQPRRRGGLHVTTLRGDAVHTTMPPRRSARVAAVVERESSALPPLPHAVVLAIFALVPVDQRLLCRLVCRGWRAVLGDVSLWLRLDLTHESGGVTFEVTDALLRAAAARVGGRLQALDVSEAPAVTQKALLTVLRENALGLRELRACHGAADRMEVVAVEALLRAAPQLRSFEVDADGGTPEACCATKASSLRCGCARCGAPPTRWRASPSLGWWRWQQTWPRIRR